TLAGLDDFRGDQAALLVDHDRAQGHFQHAILAVGAVLVGTAPVLAALGIPVRFVLIIDQVVRVAAARQHDVAAAAAVATVGSAPRLIFFPAKRNASAPAVTGLHLYFA